MTDLANNKLFFEVPQLEEASVYKETVSFKVLFLPKANPFDVLRGLPNFFVLSKETGKIEHISNTMSQVDFFLNMRL